MPQIPISSPLGYIGVFLLLFGFLLILAGLGILTITQALEIKPGKKTWSFGIFFIVIGVVFLSPDISESFPQSSTPTATAIGAAPTPTTTPVPPTNTPAQKKLGNTTSVEPTNTPQPTNTPPHLIPTPTATIDADPTVYDNFNNPAFDNTFNPDQWFYVSDMSGQVFQQDGILVVSQEGSLGNTGLFARQYNHFILKAPIFFEAKLMVKNYQNGHVFLHLGSDLNSNDYSDCTLGYGDELASFDCSYLYRGEVVYTLSNESVNYDEWQTARIEVDPSTMTFTYYFNDQELGSYRSANADQLKDANLYFDIGIWSESSETVTGYIDDVRIGQLGQ